MLRLRIRIAQFAWRAAALLCEGSCCGHLVILTRKVSIAAHTMCDQADVRAAINAHVTIFMGVNVPTRSE